MIRDEKFLERLKATDHTPEDMADICREFYLLQGNLVGGCLHIVLDDGNWADSNIEFCIDQAKEQGDENAIALGEILLQIFNMEGRLEIDRLLWEKA